LKELYKNFLLLNKINAADKKEKDSEKMLTFEEIKKSIVKTSKSFKIGGGFGKG
jgi:hypothetical protein